MKRIFAEVTSIVSNQLGVSLEEVSLSKSLIDDLGASSLDLVLIFSTIEDQFGLIILEEVAREMRTVGDIVACI